MAPQADPLQAGDRMAKRRRALLESNSPRNSRPETHRNDERGGGRPGAPVSLFLGFDFDCGGLAAEGPTQSAGPRKELNYTEKFGIPQKRHRVILLGVRSDLIRA
jgi:hypothetical protein